MKTLFCIAFILLSSAHLSLAQQARQSDSQLSWAQISDEIQTLRNEIKVLSVKIEEMDKRIAAQFNAQESKISIVQWTLNLLIVIIVAILALPQAISFIRERSFDKHLIS